MDKNEVKDVHCEPASSEDLLPQDPLLSDDGEARRRFLKQALLAGGGLAAANLLADYQPASAKEANPKWRSADVPAGLISINLRINGSVHLLQVEPQATVLDVVRERLDLTGSKKGCDRGQCGACTMLVDGRRINSCLALAAAYEGKEITTIEGLAHGDQLHPLQTAFIKHDGFQCGYCTPGQIMSAAGFLNEGCPPGMNTRECLSGNICRCGAYPGIVAAVEEVRGTRA